jgi:hypothetical protein
MAGAIQDKMDVMISGLKSKHHPKCPAVEFWKLPIKNFSSALTLCSDKLRV